MLTVITNNLHLKRLGFLIELRLKRGTFMIFFHGQQQIIQLIINTIFLLICVISYHPGND